MGVGDRMISGNSYFPIPDYIRKNQQETHLKQGKDHTPGCPKTTCIYNGMCEHACASAHVRAQTHENNREPVK